MKQEYTLGFLFSEDLEHVLLIKKNRPEWQKGFLNGIGGKIEKNESKLDCMIREFSEETNLDIDNWDYMGIYEGSSYNVHIFATIVNYSILKLFKSITDEEVSIYRVNDILTNKHYVLPSAKTAIALTLQKITDKTMMDFKVCYQ